MDTPGVLWPKFDDEETGLKLAFLGSVNDEILDREELASLLASRLLTIAPRLLEDRYGISIAEQKQEGEASERTGEVSERTAKASERTAEASEQSAGYKILCQIAEAPLLYYEGRSGRRAPRGKTFAGGVPQRKAGKDHAGASRIRWETRKDRKRLRKLGTVRKAGIGEWREC